MHKANSFKKTIVSRSKSPIKTVISNIQNTSRKIQMLKLNSIAFKRTSDPKSSEKEDQFSHNKSNSNCDEEEKSFNFPSNKNIERTIISPIRCEIPDGWDNGKKN